MQNAAVSIALRNKLRNNQHFFRFGALIEACTAKGANQCRMLERTKQLL
jgi:hypothetical protein